MGDVDHDQAAEGWYIDPYGIHEQRWMSSGRPTSLVRDGSTEATDEPPGGSPTGPLVPPPVIASPFAHDLLRADDVDRQPSPDLGYYAQVAMDKSALVNNPFLGAEIRQGFATPFPRKLRPQARRKRWSRRWHGLSGGPQSPDPGP
jgi:hypothetical protein